MAAKVMTEKEVLKIFKAEKALLSGHFLLSSGLHSPGYLQCALLLQKPWIAERLCKALAGKISKKKVDAVLGPALGGVIVSHEMGRALKARSLFAERVEGTLTLRRGFSLKKNEKVLVVEDVVTTGKSTGEVVEIVKAAEAKLVGVAALVDRREGTPAPSLNGAPLESLLKMNIRTYAPQDCPLCREGKIPAVKPGSRNV